MKLLHSSAAVIEGNYPETIMTTTIPRVDDVDTLAYSTPSKTLKTKEEFFTSTPKSKGQLSTSLLPVFNDQEIN